MSRPADLPDLSDDLFAETPTVEVAVTAPGRPRTRLRHAASAGPAGTVSPARPSLRSPLRHQPLAPRPLSPHAGTGARPAPPGPDEARRARRRRRAALLAGAAILLAAVVGLAASATALPSGESWGAELAVSGGDDVNVRLADGAVRLATPSTATKRSEGVMVLAPRRPAAPTNAITTNLTVDLPPGTAARVDVRGVLPDGSWSPWIATRTEVRAVLPATTTQVQARIVLDGGSGTVSPAVQRLWLTTSSTTAPAAGTTAPVAPSTTAVPPSVDPASPTTTTPAPPAGGGVQVGLPGVVGGLSVLSAPDGPKGEAPGAAAPSTAAPSTAVSTVPTKSPQASASTTTTSAAPTTSATPAAPAAGGPVAAVVKALWDSDITGQSLGMFKDTPWNVQGAKQPTVVPATDLPGKKALRFTMPGGGQRAEIEPDVDNFTDGQDRYIRLTLRLDPGFPVDTDTWQVITQFKNEGTGSPPLELRIGNGNYILSGGYDHPGGSQNFDHTIAPAVTGKVTTLVLHVKFADDSKTSVVDAWVDGQQKVAGFHPPGGTLYSGDYSYWKLGIYRDTSIGQTATYELSDARLGDSYASVAGG